MSIVTISSKTATGERRHKSHQNYFPVTDHIQLETSNKIFQQEG